MKNLLILTLSILMLASCEESKKHNYTIKHNNSTYKTNSYTTDDKGCINFVSDSGCVCGEGGQDITICDSWLIITNKKSKTTQSEPQQHWKDNEGF
jgi:hypothetical protein